MSRRPEHVAERSHADLLEQLESPQALRGRRSTATTRTRRASGEIAPWRAIHPARARNRLTSRGRAVAIRRAAGPTAVSRPSKARSQNCALLDMAGEPRKVGLRKVSDDKSLQLGSTRAIRQVHRSTPRAPAISGLI